MPELDIPALDPFKLENVKEQINLGLIISAGIEIKYFLAIGFKGAVIKDIMADWYTHEGEIRVLFPQINIKANLNVLLKLLLPTFDIPIYMEGYFNDVSVSIKGNLKVVTRNGKEYYQPDQLYYSATISKGKLKITSKNLVAQIFGSAIANIFNISPRISSRLLSPVALLLTRKEVKERMNLTLSHATTVEWVPPN